MKMFNVELYFNTCRYMTTKIELFKLKIKIHFCLTQIVILNIIWFLIIQMNPKDYLLLSDNLYFRNLN